MKVRDKFAEWMKNGKGTLLEQVFDIANAGNQQVQVASRTGTRIVIAESP